MTENLVYKKCNCQKLYFTQLGPQTFIIRVHTWQPISTKYNASEVNFIYNERCQLLLKKAFWNWDFFFFFFCSYIIYVPVDYTKIVTCANYISVQIFER